MDMPELPELTKAELEELFKADRNKFMALVSMLIELQVHYARNDINHFVQFVMQDEKTGAYLRQDPAHIELQKFIDENQYCLIWGGVGVGKAQPLSAKVLTPSGWRRMGDLKVGDEVTDPDCGFGIVTEVLPRGRRRVVRVTLENGSSTVCDLEHQWLVGLNGFSNQLSMVTTTEHLLSVGLHIQGTTKPRWLVPIYRGRLTGIVSISSVGEEDVQCIAVSTKRNLYVTDDMIVTHNCVTEKTTFILQNNRRVTLKELLALFESNKSRGLKTYVKTLTDDGVLLDVPVKDIFYNGKQQVYRVVTQSGHATTVSWNHPFRTMRHRFNAIEHGVFEWVHPTMMAPSLYGEMRYTPDSVVVAGPLPSIRTASNAPDEQEAWDLGFMVGLICDRMRGHTFKYRQSDGAEVWHLPYGGNARSKKITSAISNTLEEIAKRRGFYVEFSTRDHPSSVHPVVTAKIYGMAWLRSRGVEFHVTTRTLSRKMSNGEARPVTLKKVTARADNGYVLNIILDSGMEACRAYLAGLLVHLTEDSEWQHIASVSVGKWHRSLVDLGHACKISTRSVRTTKVDSLLRVRRERLVFFESPSILSVYNVIRKMSLPLWAYFSEVYDTVKHSFDTIPPADTHNLQRSKKYNNVFKKYGVRQRAATFLRQWIPRSESIFQVSTVLTCRPVGVKDTWGVEIDTEEHTHLTDGFLTHNTQQVTVARVLFSLGRNVNLRVLIAMSKADLAKDPMAQIKKMIEESERLHRVFPNLKRGSRWTEHEILVQRTLILNTPSVRAIGAGTKIDGSRYDLIIMDDVLSLDNTSSQSERDKLMKWIESVPLSRMEQDTKVILIGNAFHNDDPMHRFERMPNTVWKSRRFPARDPVTKKSLFPRRWPQEKIEQWERSRTPHEVRRAIDCIPFSNESSRFHLDWFEVALSKGANIHVENGEFVHFLSSYNLHEEQDKVQEERDRIVRLDRQARDELIRSGRRHEAIAMKDTPLPPMPVGVFSGVDLGFGVSSRADQTVIFTAVVFDDGTFRVINIEKGRWQPPTTITMLVDTHRRYGSEIFMEAQYTQRFVYDIVKHDYPDLPIYPWDTRGTGTVGNKWHAIFGIESVAADLGFGRWVLPCVVRPWKPGDDEDEKNRRELHPLIREFIDACLYFVPDSTVHTDDILMAAWITLQGARARGSHEYLAALIDINAHYEAVRDEEIVVETSSGGISTAGLWDELRDLTGDLAE